jgi:hypothetical protein
VVTAFRWFILSFGRADREIPWIFSDRFDLAPDHNYLSVYLRPNCGFVVFIDNIVRRLISRRPFPGSPSPVRPLSGLARFARFAGFCLYS